MGKTKKPQIDSIKSVTEEVLTFASESLVKRAELGNINFEEGEENINNSIRLFQKLAEHPLANLPLPILSKLLNDLNALAGVLRNIRKFSLDEHNDPKTRRDNLLESLEENYSNVFQYIVPYLSYPDDYAIDTVKKQSKEILENLKTTQAEAMQTKETLNAILQYSQNASAEIGVVKFSRIFEAMADYHQKFGNIWLGSTCLLALLTVLAAVVLLLWVPLNSQEIDPTTIQQIGTRIIVISLLYYGAIWASQNYRSHRHLFVVNKHRQNSLTTFETFVGASQGDNQIKNAVLLEATHCIFSPSTTGYLGKDKDESPNSRIIEVMKSFGSSPK